MIEEEWKNGTELPKQSNVFLGRVAQFGQAEDALRESEEKWRFLLRNTPDVILNLDRKGTILFINHTVPGYTVEDTVGKTIYDFIPPEQHEKTRNAIAKVFQTGEAVDFETSIIRPDGSLLRYSTRLGPVKNGDKIVGVTQIFTDIAERKKAEDVLRESEQRYRDIFNSATDAILILDLEKHIVDANFEACKMFGYSRDEMIGLAVQKLVRPDYRRKPEEFKSEIEAKGQIHFEAVNLRKDGNPFNVEVRGTIFAHNGKKHFLIAIRDITERKKAEEALRMFEERFSGLAERSFDLIFMTDAQGYLTYVSNASEKILDYKPEEMVGTHFKNYLIKSEIPRVSQLFAENMRGENLGVFQMEAMRKDGSSVFIELNSAPILKDGETIGMQGIIRDITERKKAEDELQESEQRFRAIFYGAADGMLLADLESKKFQTANKMICQMLGYSPEEFKNLGVADIHHEEDLPYVIEQFEKQSRGEFTLSRDIPVKRKDGSVFYADINSVTMTLRGKTYLMGIFRDVTDRKRAEEALRASESKYRTLVENLPQKIFLKDKNSVFVSCNDNLARDFKIKSEEITGKTDYDFLPKELADKYRADDKRIIESGQTEAIEEKYIEEGEERIVHTVKTPVKDEQGNVIGVLGIFWDITELKRREKELNIYRQKMARAEQLASLGTLSATLAHELTQPLTVMRLSIENALMKLETTSSAATIIKNIKDSLTEVSNITSIVERFRNYARKSSKTGVSKVDLKAVAERTVQLLSESARQAKVTLQLEGMDELPPVYSSEKDLDQLFFALIENAVQAAGGKKNRRLIISGAVQDEQIELRFSDDCGGIAPENLDRIFEPFFTTKPAGEGTGLGLCVVQRIILGAGGKVRVESKAGKGTTFFITLPINRGKVS